MTRLRRAKEAATVNTLVHVALLLALPPLLLGVINKTKAWFAGRAGRRSCSRTTTSQALFRKDMVLSATTTWVFRAGPGRHAGDRPRWPALLVPLGAFDAPVAFAGDLVLFAYLFGPRRASSRPRRRSTPAPPSRAWAPRAR